jgi:hypothetical protein
VVASVVIGVLSLLVAGAVVLFAYLNPERGGTRLEGSPWQAFRGGLRRGSAPDGSAVRMVDISLTEMLITADDHGEAYVTTGEFQQTFERARDRAASLATQVIPARRRTGPAAPQPTGADPMGTGPAGTDTADAATMVVENMVVENIENKVLTAEPEPVGAGLVDENQPVEVSVSSDGETSAAKDKRPC